MRRVVLKLGRCLEAVAQARGQADLVDAAGTGNHVLYEVENAATALRRLITSANRRVLGVDDNDIAVVAEVPPLPALIERSVSSGVPPNAPQLAMAISELSADLPAPIAQTIERVLSILQTLPIAAPSDVFAIPLGKRRENLPDWLLPRRTIGAFYVERALGSGGASSVFVARRIEERNSTDAEGFALKVPDYDPTTARSLSEQEFLQLFREEAGALLTVPQHPNLARFVTFDLAARPKPILVMELIKGLSLDRLVRSRSLSTERAFHYLDGILAGLEAMHSAGIGHLDVKPSNVILRDGETPVLVDFGLSGRKLRPGCGTLEYCSPEVIGVIPEGLQPGPQPVDLYAFGCIAYEMLMAETLFYAEGEMALLTLHVEHDGWPEKVARLGRDATFGDLGKLLARCLRRDPRKRPTAQQARAELASLAKRYKAARVAPTNRRPCRSANGLIESSPRDRGRMLAWCAALALGSIAACRGDQPKESIELVVPDGSGRTHELVAALRVRRIRRGSRRDERASRDARDPRRFVRTLRGAGPRRHRPRRDAPNAAERQTSPGKLRDDATLDRRRRRQSRAARLCRSGDPSQGARLRASTRRLDGAFARRSRPKRQSLGFARLRIPGRCDTTRVERQGEVHGASLPQRGSARRALSSGRSRAQCFLLAGAL